jgi:hypothetical protein
VLLLRVVVQHQERMSHRWRRQQQHLDAGGVSSCGANQPPSPQRMPSGSGGALCTTTTCGPCLLALLLPQAAIPTLSVLQVLQAIP